MARRGETVDDPAGTLASDGGGESNGGTGLYNVSNTGYLNSVLQALSHVREFRECLLSDASGVSLYAAGVGRGRVRSPGRPPVPTPEEEILSFPGFKKKRKRKKGEDGDEEEETTVVPVCACHRLSQSRRLAQLETRAVRGDVTVGVYLGSIAHRNGLSRVVLESM